MQEKICLLYTSILPDDREILGNRMKEIADKELAELVLTTGGTGFSQRDVTPEATEDIICLLYTSRCV